MGKSIHVTLPAELEPAIARDSGRRGTSIPRRIVEILARHYKIRTHPRPPGRPRKDHKNAGAQTT